MWKSISIVFLCTLYWSCVVSDDCVTPLGRKSQCVLLDKCTTLLAGAKQRPQPPYVLPFLKESICGFEGRNAKVCCGPFQWNRSPVDDSVLASRSQCGIDRDGDRIYGGENAKDIDFPWMALLGYKKPNTDIKYKCGGSLINQRYVLTAAHCVVGKIIEVHGIPTTVRLGEHDVNCQYDTCERRRQEIPIDSVHAHPEYIIGASNNYHDIGIVRLAKRATYTYYVQPICLVDNDMPPVHGDKAVVSGWGKTLFANSSPVKRKLNVTIFDKDACSRLFQRKFNLPLIDKQLCAGGIFKEDACKGDSGGPLMMKSVDHKWKAVGVVSFGNGCGLEGWPGIYTHVGGYLDWISATLRSIS